MTRAVRRLLAALAASAAVGACAAALLYAEMNDLVSGLLFGGVLAWGLFAAATTPRRVHHRATRRIV